VPSAVTPVDGEADRVEVPATGAPAIKVTVVVTPPKPEGVEIARVFTSATVEVIKPVVSPLAFVVTEGWVREFPVPVEVNAADAPLTGFPPAS